MTPDSATPAASPSSGAERRRRSLATLELPIPLGRAAIAPGIGVGVGWLETSRDEPPRATGCMPRDDEGCPESYPLWVGDGFRSSRLGARVGVRLVGRIPLVDQLALELAVAADANPSARRTPAPAAERTTSEGATAPDPRFPPDVYALPPEPGRGYRFGVGLSYGFR
jgi:hypothetical protein